MLDNKKVKEKIILNSIIDNLKSKYRLNFKTEIEDNFQYFIKYSPTSVYTNYFYCGDDDLIVAPLKHISKCVGRTIKIGEDSFSIFYLTIILDTYKKLIFGSNIFEIDNHLLDKLNNTLYTEQYVYDVEIESLQRKTLKYVEQ